MIRSKTIRLGLLLILAAALAIPGCDTLVTENNTITVYSDTVGRTCLDGCHNDANNIITIPRGQWENSAHASHQLIEKQVTLNGTQYWTNNAECGARCHSSEGYIDLVENDVINTQAITSPIGCYTCHLPHTGDFNNWSIDTLRGDSTFVFLENGKTYNFGKSNMCARCHQAPHGAPLATQNITLTGDWGPHFSPQADVVSGEGGYRYNDGIFPDSLIPIPVHSQNLASKDGCLSCHFGADPLGYDFGQHTFRLEDSLEYQYVDNCNIPVCHNNTLSAFYESTTISEADSLAELIRAKLETWNILDSDTLNPSFFAGSSLHKFNIPILYNYLLFKQDGSRGVHNPVLMHSLMTTTAARIDSMPPKANFILATPGDTLTCDTALVSFINTSVSNTDVYEWLPGDGGLKGTNLDFNYIYNVPGTYSVTLVASGPGDHVDSITYENLIVVEGNPIAQFTADRPTICQDDEVAFSDQSVYSRSWSWDFGDGGIDSVQNPTHAYANIGSYTVTLTVDGLCGSDDSVMTDYIFVRDSLLPAVAAFTQSADSVDWGTQIDFTNTSDTLASADFWFWDFGDGNFDSSSTQASFNPSHVYDSIDVIDTFEVSLTVMYGCNDSTVVNSIIVTPKP